MTPSHNLIVFFCIMVVFYLIYAGAKMADHYIPKERREQIINIIKVNGTIILSACIITLVINGCVTIYKVLS